MHIYGKTRIDSQGRIVLTNFFAEKEMPKKIGLSIDIDSEMIFVKNNDRADSNIPATPINVDSKNRICIPKWILEELELSKYEKKNYFLFFIKETVIFARKRGQFCKNAPSLKLGAIFIRNLVVDF